MRDAGGASGAVDVQIHGRARPSELIGLAIALEEREALDERDRRRLDREFRERVGARAEGDGLSVLRCWLEEAPTTATRARIARVRSSLATLRTMLIAVGLFFGWAAAAALLQVEVHEGRVNIVLCLGLLVLLPFAMLLVALAGAAWFGRASAPQAGLSGGWRGWAFARGAMAVLPTSVRQDVEVLFGRMAAHDRLYARARRAQFFLWSQWVGAGFAIGTLLSTLSFVVFTDLAFGWSTTLEVAAESVHELTRALSAPWAKLWPEAAPSLDLVETTRHFRVAPNAPHVHFIDPIRYGGWWPFLVMALLCYAVLPRTLATLIAGRRLGLEVGEAIALTPGAVRLLERLTQPVVETRATEVEGETGRAVDGRVESVEARDWIAVGDPDQHVVIAWAESISDDAVFSVLGTNGMWVRDAGGRRSLEEDAERIAECAARAGRVALCVRAYEPPMLEVLDFLADLRVAIGPARGLAVFLLDGDERARDAWLHKLVTLGDPSLVCAGLSSRGAAK